MFRSSNPGKQTGLSLLEVLIATLVLSTGLLGLASLQIAGMKTTHNSFQMQQATWIVYDLLERMRANRAEALRVNSGGAPASAYLINSRSDVFCASGNQPTADCSDTQVQCTTAQMATYDIYSLMCGYGGGDGIVNNLLDGQLVVLCPTGNCSAGGVQVRLQWNERNSSQQATDLDGDTDGLEGFNISLNVSL